VKPTAQPEVSLPSVICRSLLTCCSAPAATEAQAEWPVATTLSPRLDLNLIRLG
jgi:hypothetical protein